MFSSGKERVREKINNNKSKNLGICFSLKKEVCFYPICSRWGKVGSWSASCSSLCLRSIRRILPYNNNICNNKNK